MGNVAGPFEHANETGFSKAKGKGKSPMVSVKR